MKKSNQTNQKEINNQNSTSEITPDLEGKEVTMVEFIDNYLMNKSKDLIEFDEKDFIKFRTYVLFREFERNRGEILAKDVNTELIEAFYDFLLIRCKDKPKIGDYLLSIAQFTTELLKDGFINIDPFQKFKVPESSHIPNVDIQEIINIEIIDLTDSIDLYHTRNLFMFSYHRGGIPFSALYRLKWKDIKDGEFTCTENGKIVKRCFNPNEYPDSILEEYGYPNGEMDEYVFPFLKSNQRNDNRDRQSIRGLEEVEIMASYIEQNQRLNEITDLFYLSDDISFGKIKYIFEKRKYLYLEEVDLIGYPSMVYKSRKKLN